MRSIQNFLYRTVCWFLVFPVLFVLACLARCFRKAKVDSLTRPRLIWSGAPLPSLPAVSEALSAAEYTSVSVANQRYSINYEGQFDVVLAPKKRIATGLNTPWYLWRIATYFAKTMFTYDIYHSFFTGGILGNSPLLSSEAFLWKLSGGKLVVFPYGQDGFVYSELPDAPWANAIKETYPRSTNDDKIFKSRITSLSKSADCVVGCLVHTINLPRVDVWPLLWYPAGMNVELIEPQPVARTGTLKVAHATNHRSIKGTDAIIAAVKNLKKKGIDISLDLIENVPIDVSRARLAQADVVVDQLLMGYAMAALEGLQLGKAVVSGFDDSLMYQQFYKHSYLGDCPIIPANPDTVESVLEALYNDRDEIVRLSQHGVSFAQEHHSDDACVRLFEAIYDKIWFKRNIDLSSLYLK